MSRIALLIGICLSVAPAYGRTSCGGEGPQPFVTVGKTPQLPMKKIWTKGPVEDFVLRDTGQLIYRNQRKWAYALGNSHGISLGFVPRDLQSVGGGYGRFLLTHDSGQDSASVIDLLTKKKFHTQVPLGATPLFWHQRILFWGLKKKTSSTRSVLEVSHQLPHSSATQHMCTVTWSGPQDLDVVSGSRFPGVLLYSTLPVGAGDQLAFYNLDVRTCKVKPIAAYGEPTSGPVQSVHYFKSVGGWAVQMDHPQNNLLWDNGQKCRYYNLGNQPLIPLEAGEPVVATWSGRDGLSLWALESQKRQKVLPPGYASIGRKDVAVDPRSMEIFVRTARSGSKDYRLWVSDLDARFLKPAL